MDGISPRLITDRGDFQRALREVFAALPGSDCRELWLCDEDFADWPLGEVAVVEALGQWINSRRKLVVVARHYDEVLRRHPRWVTFRRQWAHVVDCQGAEAADIRPLPVLLIASGACVLRLADATQHRGRLSIDLGDIRLSREGIDAILQQSGPAFPATTLGI
jgi:hypothetical protein